MTRESSVAGRVRGKRLVERDSALTCSSSTSSSTPRRIRTSRAACACEHDEPYRRFAFVAVLRIVDDQDRYIRGRRDARRALRAKRGRVGQGDARPRVIAGLI